MLYPRVSASTLFSPSVPKVLHLCCTLYSSGETLKFSVPRLQPDSLHQNLWGRGSDSTGDFNGQLWLRTTTWAAKGTWGDPDEHHHTHFSPECKTCASHHLVGVTNYTSHGNNLARAPRLSTRSPITHHSRPVVHSSASPPKPKKETLETLETPASSVSFDYMFPSSATPASVLRNALEACILLDNLAVCLNIQIMNDSTESDRFSAMCTSPCSLLCVLAWHTGTYPDTCTLT